MIEAISHGRYVKRKKVCSNVVKSCNQIIIFLESSDIPENKNQCFHLNGNILNSLSGFKNGPLKYLVLTISLTSDKAILERDNKGYAYNCVGEVKYGLIKYTLLTHIFDDNILELVVSPLVQL